jgi:hypothetical protein
VFLFDDKVEIWLSMIYLMMYEMTRTMISDEDMTPSDTTVDYKVCSFLYLHSDFGYNSLVPYVRVAI